MHFPTPNNNRRVLSCVKSRTTRVAASLIAIAGTVFAPLTAVPGETLTQIPTHTSPVAAPSAPAAITAPAPAARSAVYTTDRSAPPTSLAPAVAYPHVAALRMASQVNSIRRSVTPTALSRHDLRVLHHEQRIAAKAAVVKQRQVRVAMQNKALHSGNVIEAATAFRGTRYVMGGTSRSGFDCSGFVRYILANTGGVEIPRTASEQYWHGQPIAIADMQAGDLVFFKNTYKHGISHVGIYAGNGKFIHAANSHKGVRQDDLNSPYYLHHFAGARRVLPEDQRRIAAGH